MNHRIGRLIFASGVGLAVAFLAYQWITNPVPRAERQLEEAVVAAARRHLEESLSLSGLDIVDPLAPDRKVGKSYVYRAPEGWEISGYYRRGEGDRWHPFLMELDDAQGLVRLKIKDGALVERGRTDARLEVIP